MAEQEDKTNEILQKLLSIIKNDQACIIENKDVFTQILTAIDEETLTKVFKTPTLEIIQKQDTLELVQEV